MTTTTKPKPTVRWVQKGICKSCGHRGMTRGQALALWHHKTTEKTRDPSLAFRGYCGQCEPTESETESTRPAPLVALTDPAELRLLRKHMGLTQGDFAWHAGISQATVCKIEHGRSTRLTTLRSYLVGLGVHEGDVHYEVVS